MVILGVWVNNSVANYIRHAKPPAQIIPYKTYTDDTTAAHYESYKNTKSSNNLHQTQSINDVVEPMVPISHHNLHINNTVSLYNQHERLPILVPNPHYVKPQHTVTDFRYQTSSPHVSYHTPSSSTAIDAQKQTEMLKTDSPHAQQFLSQENDFSMPSPHSSTHSNSPIAVKTKPTRGNRSYQCPKCTKVSFK